MKARPGVVLLLALLCLIALELSAAGLQFAALQQVRIAHAGSRALQLRLSTQSAVATALDNWQAAAALRTPVGGQLTLPGTTGRDDHWGITYEATAERLSASLFLISAQARSPLGESARVGFLTVMADPVQRLVSAAVRSAGTVSVQAGARLTAGSGSCPAEALPAAAQVGDAAFLLTTGDAVISGMVEVRPELRGAPLSALLPIPLGQLLAEAAGLNLDRWQPAPVVQAGHCATGILSNWGEPVVSTATEPCRTWFPVLQRTGDLILDGGRGQGVLYVTGNLVLAAGASFAGVVLVEGSLTLLEGAEVRGSVVAGGDVTMLAASIQGDHCAASAALADIPRLAGPFSPTTRRWIPLF